MGRKANDDDRDESCDDVDGEGCDIDCDNDGDGSDNASGDSENHGDNHSDDDNDGDDIGDSGDDGDRDDADDDRDSHDFDDQRRQRRAHLSRESPLQAIVGRREHGRLGAVVESAGAKSFQYRAPAAPPL